MRQPTSRRSDRTRIDRARLGAVVAMSLASAAHGGGCIDESAVVDNQIVLRIAPGASIASILAAVQAEFPGLAPISSIPAINAWLVNVPEPLCESAAIDALEDDRRVLEIGFNDLEQSSEGQTQSFYFISETNQYTEQPAWDLLNVWDAHTFSTGLGVRIAIIDSGVDAGHPAFVGASFLPGISFLPGGPADVGDGIDNDGDGYIDESVGHGTHLAGLIHLIAPHAELLPIRVLDSDGVTNVFTLSAGVVAAAQAGAGIINISISSPEAATVLDEAVAYATSGGAILVASAGNLNDESMQFPAALPDVLSIASTSLVDEKSAFSSFGETIDLCVTGDEIVGPIPGGLYGSWSGTSMAAGIASGVAALTLARASDVAVATDALLATAIDIDAANPNFVGKLGAGRLDALAAVMAIPSADLNGDGTVNSADLAILLGVWGRCAGCPADLDRDGAVGSSDLSILLGSWG